MIYYPIKIIKTYARIIQLIKVPAIMTNQKFYFKLIVFIVFLCNIISCRDDMDTSKFDIVDDATRITVNANLTSLPQIDIDDLDKVNFAKEFIHKYAKGENWEGPPFSIFPPSYPGFTFSIGFYENNEFLFFLGFDLPNTLVRVPYKKSIPKEEMTLLIDTLDIPKEYTVRP